MPVESASLERRLACRHIRKNRLGKFSASLAQEVDWEFSELKEAGPKALAAPLTTVNLSDTVRLLPQPVSFSTDREGHGPWPTKTESLFGDLRLPQPTPL